MIERQIPKEIGTKEIAFMARLSLRQCIWLAGGVVSAILVYMILPDAVSFDNKLIIAALVLIPFVLCMFFKKYRMFFKEFISRYIYCNFQCSSNRRYKSYNQYQQLELRYDNQHPVKVKKEKNEYKRVKIK